MSDELNSPGLRQLRAVLDDSAASIDAATLSRLNRARQAALASRASRPRYALPLGLALAASLVLVVVVARRQPDNESAPVARMDVPASTPAPAVAHEEAPVRAHQDAPAVAPALKSVPAPKEAMAVALDAADVADDFADLPGDGPDELAQEDLEFYAWLDAQEAQDG